MSSVRGFLILDFGSQLTQLIARRLRELGYYSEIHPYHFSTDKIRQLNPFGIILSGGPASVYEEKSPQRNLRELKEISPLFGICYGMQLIAKEFGGMVESSDHREYGNNTVEWKMPIAEVPLNQKVWMSHGDRVRVPPPGLSVAAVSAAGIPAALIGDGILAVQFHPEVSHTEAGGALLKHFAQNVCHAPADWNPPHMLEVLIQDAKAKVKDEHVVCGLSGGVDSTVVALLLTRALTAERVHCVFVDTGLLRKDEYENVLKQYEGLGLNVRGVDAQKDFLAALKGLEDPEAKRKAIGKMFIDVFEREIHNLENTGKGPKAEQVQWLAQGTLYPDVIESVPSFGGPSQTIKSHHNVGGLPERMKLKLLEPVRELFKDEVRALGREMKTPAALVGRHPFPGPGLAIRVIGDVTEEKLKIVREADAIFINKLIEKNLYHKIWQAFCVLLPVQTVGVQGDGRTYDRVLALRAVTSVDGMTADWYPFEFEFLREVSNEITNRVKGVSRVVYDITSKPPATIEWE